MPVDYGTGGKATEVLLSGGDLQYCTTLTGEISAGSFVSVGYTDKEAGGTLRDAQPTFVDVKVTGLDDPVKRKAQDREVTFSGILLQATPTNLALASGGLAADVAAGVFLGGKSKDASEMKWRYTVQNDDAPTKDQRLYLMRVKVVESVEVPWADNKVTAIKMTLKAYAVTDATVVRSAASLVGYRYVLEEGSF